MSIDNGKFIAEGTVKELIAKVPPKDNTPLTLEDVFIALTGKNLEEGEE